jgi:hypothetical protein
MSAIIGMDQSTRADRTEIEFTGKAGRMYLNGGADQEWELWFEDFCILGTGNTPHEALENALAQTAQMLSQVAIASEKLRQMEREASK